jgi:hypothetical protein
MRKFADLFNNKNGEEGRERIITAPIKLACIAPHAFDMRNESFVLFKADLERRPG